MTINSITDTMWKRETLPRQKLSGHSSNSKEFFKYVNYAQKHIDQEVENALGFLDTRNNLQLKSTKI